MIVQGEPVARWVMQPIGAYTERMVGIGYERGGILKAGVAFENFNGNNMFGHQRIDAPPSREFWIAIADYIFNFCGCKRFTATVESDNIKAIELNKHIGFEIEATLKIAGRNGDLIIMVLWPEKCRPLHWKRRETPE